MMESKTANLVTTEKESLKTMKISRSAFTNAT